jgi:predicted  nucleic acid-binding Zn-ribbon protein
MSHNKHRHNMLQMQEMAQSLKDAREERDQSLQYIRRLQEDLQHERDQHIAAERKLDEMKLDAHSSVAVHEERTKSLIEHVDRLNATLVTERENHSKFQDTFSANTSFALVEIKEMLKNDNSNEQMKDIRKHLENLIGCIDGLSKRVQDSTKLVEFEQRISEKVTKLEAAVEALAKSPVRRDSMVESKTDTRPQETSPNNTFEDDTDDEPEFVSVKPSMPEPEDLRKSLSDSKKIHKEALATLEQLGFKERNLNALLLNAYNGDVHKTVAELERLKKR